MMPDITNCLGNASENHTEVTPHTHQDGHYKKNTENDEGWQGCRKTETLVHGCGTEKMVQLHGKQYVGLKKLKME